MCKLSLSNPPINNVSQERWKEIHEKYPHFPKEKDMVDLNTKRREASFRMPASWEWWLTNKAGWVNDPRDSIMLSTMFSMIVVLGPIYTWLALYPSHWVGFLGYACTFSMWAQRFFLMAHYAEHRNTICHWIPKAISSFLIMIPFGFPAGLYKLHHCVMHHVGNNVTDEDWSSTEPYQRDSFLNMLLYVARNWGNILGVPFFAIKKGRYDLAKVSIGSEIVWLGFCYMCWCYNSTFAFWAVIMPAITTPSVLMVGNFWQHIFIHPSVADVAPKDAHGYAYNAKISYQSMNHLDNWYAFNDGYHLTHHVNSRVHWTQMPEHFLDNLELYVEGGALVFDGIGIADIGLYCFFGRLDWVADRLVQFTKEKKSKEEIIADLKLRLKPIYRNNKPAGKDAAKAESQSTSKLQASPMKRKPL